MQIVTGHTGEPHVTPVDDSVRNTMLGEFGGKVVLPIFERFDAYAATANAVRVYSGYGMNQGRLFRIDRNTYDTCVIENGTVGMKRCDLIVARYTQNETTGVETIRLEVIRGETGSAYVDPAYETGDLMANALIDDMPLYRVKINGIVIEEVEPMFEVYKSTGRVSFEQGLDAGTLVGEINIDGEKTKLYAPHAQGHVGRIFAETTITNKTYGQALIALATSLKTKKDVNGESFEYEDLVGSKLKVIFGGVDYLFPQSLFNISDDQVTLCFRGASVDAQYSSTSNFQMSISINSNNHQVLSANDEIYSDGRVLFTDLTDVARYGQYTFRIIGGI